MTEDIPIGLRTCKTCKHDALHWDDEPCNTCLTKEVWLARELWEPQSSASSMRDEADG